ncbi:hypothetical protein ABMX62_10705 [Vibrio vulnificus]|uniref:lipopolysaccharide biosynthesis protein n=1 Tax=Vibrio vulnificus TaxID=672 RepID=UPI004059D248
MSKSFIQSVGIDMSSKVLNIFLVLFIMVQVSASEYAKIGVYTSLLMIFSGGVACAMAKYELFGGRNSFYYTLTGLISVSLTAIFYYLYEAHIAVLFFSLCIIPLVYIERLKAYYISVSKLDLIYKIEFFRVLVLVIILSLSYFYLHRMDFVNFAISYTISYWVVFLWLSFKVSFQSSNKNNPALLYSFLKNKSLFIYFFSIAFGFQLDFYFLSVFSSEEQLASYNAAYRIYMIMVSLVVIFQNFILGKVLSGERESFRKIKFLVLFFIIILYISGYVYFEFILNAKFYSASGVLAILSLSCILSTIYAEKVNKYLCQRRFFKPAIIAIFSVSINAILGFSLVQWLGEFGAAISTLVSYFVLNFSVARLKYD